MSEYDECIDFLNKHYKIKDSDILENLVIDTTIKAKVISSELDAYGIDSIEIDCRQLMKSTPKIIADSYGRQLMDDIDTVKKYLNRKELTITKMNTKPSVPITKILQDIKILAMMDILKN